MTNGTQSLRHTDKKSGSTSETDETGSARDALKRAGDTMENNPLAVLVGGAAIGVLAGAVIPRTARETKLFGGVGKRLTTAATAAAAAAREEGFKELEARGISGKAARAQIDKLLDGVVEAAGSAGEAAASAAAKEAKASPDKK